MKTWKGEASEVDEEGERRRCHGKNTGDKQWRKRGVMGSG